MAPEYMWLYGKPEIEPNEITLGKIVDVEVSTRQDKEGRELTIIAESDDNIISALDKILPIIKSGDDEGINRKLGPMLQHFRADLEMGVSKNHRLADSYRIKLWQHEVDYQETPDGGLALSFLGQDRCNDVALHLLLVAYCRQSAQGITLPEDFRKKLNEALSRMLPEDRETE
jgi:hypothetical protein